VVRHPQEAQVAREFGVAVEQQGWQIFELSLHTRSFARTDNIII
jgi:hypothetical protein